MRIVIIVTTTQLIASPLRQLYSIWARSSPLVGSSQHKRPDASARGQHYLASVTNDAKYSTGRSERRRRVGTSSSKLSQEGDE